MRLLSTIAIAAAITGSAFSANAANLVTNGDFDTGVTMKTYFSFITVPGWTGGANLTFIDTPGSADDPSQYLTVYGPFPSTSPVGGDFVEADGDPSYSGAISQTINGLTPGHQYLVGFYQAAGQQNFFPGSTTEQWQVSLGAETQYSDLFSLPQGGVGQWQGQLLTFTADSTSDVLTFLAVGTPGGAPPISFLDGVTMTAIVPEPATWSLMLLGVLGLGAGLRRRRAERLATAAA